MNLWDIGSETSVNDPVQTKKLINKYSTLCQHFYGVPRRTITPLGI